MLRRVLFLLAFAVALQGCIDPPPDRACYPPEDVEWVTLYKADRTTPFFDDETLVPNFAPEEEVVYAQAKLHAPYEPREGLIDVVCLDIRDVGIPGKSLGSAKVFLKPGSDTSVLTAVTVQPAFKVTCRPSRSPLRLADIFVQSQESGRYQNLKERRSRVLAQVYWDRPAPRRGAKSQRVFVKCPDVQIRG